MTPQRRRSIAVIVAFAVAIVLPGLAFLAGAGRGNDAAIAAMERRYAAPPPVYDPSAGPAVFTKSVETYYDDHFPLRMQLIYGYAMLRYALFGDSPSADVVLGHERWLFLGQPAAVANYRNLAPYTEADLRYTASILESRARWLAAAHIHYLVVFAPEKSTIYPELLPQWMSRVGPRSRLDQLIAYLRAHSSVDVLDLRPALDAGKARAEVFSKGDTHWNGWGAYVGYARIIARLKEWFPVLRVPVASDVTLGTVPGGGDLINMIGLTQSVTNSLVVAIPRVPLVSHSAGVGFFEPDVPAPVAARATERAGALPHAVAFVDSFGVGLEPWLSESFGRALYLTYQKRDFDMRAIRREHPDVVIQEWVERRLMGPFDQ